MKEYVERIIIKLMEEVQDIINKYSLSLEVDTASKNLAGYFRAGNSYNTHTQGKQAIFTKYNDNKYSFKDMSEYYHIFKHDKNLVNKTKNKVKKVLAGKNNQLNNLHNKRLDTICNVINDRQSMGIVDGYRDKTLFLACVSYYYLNKYTCLDNLVRLNNALSSPLSRSEIDGIYSYVLDKRD